MALSVAKQENQKRTPLQVFLDYKPLALPEALVTVQDLLVHVQSSVLPRNRVLQHIVLDGEYLSEEGEKDSAKLRLHDYENIELHSRKVLELALEGLENARELIPAVKEDLLTSAREIRSGNVEHGLNMLHDCVLMIDWFLDLITAIESAVHREKPWLRVKGQESAPGQDEGQRAYRTFEPKEGLLEKFRDLEQAQEASDLVALADVIEYEIAPVVAVWADELPSILTQMKAETAEA